MKRTDNAEITEVIFKKDNTGEITAFFPYAPANSGNILCYVHLGQHGEASLDYYWSTRPAKESEYKPLYDELVNIVGYDLKIVHKINYNKRP